MVDKIPEWVDRAIERYGDDVAGVLRFISECVARGKTPEAQLTIDYFLTEVGLREYAKTLAEAAKEAVLADPELRQFWRPYMERLIPEIIVGRAEGKTIKEIAAELGVPVHDLWNTAWLARRAGVEITWIRE